MSTRVYSEINLHITWHTKGSLPMITPAMEPHLHSFLRNKVVETRGAYFHAIGGIQTHLHLAASVKPSVHLDEWIGQLNERGYMNLVNCLHCRLSTAMSGSGPNRIGVACATSRTHLST